MGQVPQKHLYVHVVPTEKPEEALSGTPWSAFFTFHAVAARCVGEQSRAQASSRLEEFHRHVVNWLANLGD